MCEIFIFWGKKCVWEMNFCLVWRRHFWLTKKANFDDMMINSFSANNSRHFLLQNSLETKEDFVIPFKNSEGKKIEDNLS